MSTGSRALKRTRALIDVVDDGILLLLAARRQLALGAARYKHTARLPPSDTAREQQVQHRAALLARRLGVPAATARALMALVIADARHCQGLASDVDQGAAVSGRGMIAVDLATTDTTPIEAAGTDMATTDTHHTGSRDARRSLHWLRLLPPPSRWALILSACPPALQRRLLEQAMAQALAVPLDAGALGFLQGRSLAIEVTDLCLRWVITLEQGRLRAVEQTAEASIRGSATDLLLLASRLEDADTLFFQRRLVLTGDTELGLTARNLLDRLPWEQVPLALRIMLNRGARLAQAARAAHHAA